MSLNIHIVPLGNIEKTKKLDVNRIQELMNKGFPTIDRIHVIHYADDLPNVIEVSGVPVVFHKVDDHLNYLLTLEKVISLYYKEKNAEYYVNITGGTKAMTIGAYLGATYIGARIYYLPKDVREYIEITPPRIAPKDLSDLQKKILVCLKERIDPGRNKGMTQTELSEEVKKSGQIVNYSCTQLMKSGYVKIVPDEKDRRKKWVVITDQGVMAVKLI